MVNYKIDNIEFCLREKHDLAWLRELGRVFTVFDQKDSGNISFGIENGGKKFFVKVAGLSTVESVQPKEDAVSALKEAMGVYEEIEDENLIKLVKHYGSGSLYIAVFEWVDGKCLFDHWNFDKYEQNPQLIPPARRFKELPFHKRIRVAEVLFSFLETVAEKGYVAVDFYDGSIMYDFQKDKITICDIDLFRKQPAFNDKGMDYWGSKRVKAPEEYIYGARIDEATNVYTLGAVLFHSFFGSYTSEEMRQIYEMNSVIPCAVENWELSKSCYDVAVKAVSGERKERYPSIKEFHKAWKEAVDSEGVENGKEI